MTGGGQGQWFGQQIEGFAFGKEDVWLLLDGAELVLHPFYISKQKALIESDFFYSQDYYLVWQYVNICSHVRQSNRLWSWLTVTTEMQMYSKMY